MLPGRAQYLSESLENEDHIKAHSAMDGSPCVLVEEAFACRS